MNARNGAGEEGTHTEPLELAFKARESMAAKKAADIAVIDVRGHSSVTDFVVLASGASAPQLKAMANGVQESLKEPGEPTYRRAGAPDDGWIVLDYVDVVIHIFQKELREYYALEEIWADLPRVP